MNNEGLGFLTIEGLGFYEKKPIVIEAMIWDGSDHRAMFEFLGGSVDAYLSGSGQNFYIDHNRVVGGLMIKTLEGEYAASIDDYIIKGISGEFYPCKPDIFKKTYERVDPQTLKA